MPKIIKVSFVAGGPESENLKKTLEDLTKNRKKFQVKTTGLNSMEIETDDVDHNEILAALGSKGIKTAVESLEDVLVSKLLEGASTADILSQLDSLTESPQTLQEGIGSAILALSGATIAASKISEILRAHKDMEQLREKLKKVASDLKGVVGDLEDSLK